MVLRDFVGRLDEIADVGNIHVRGTPHGGGHVMGRVGLGDVDGPGRGTCDTTASL